LTKSQSDTARPACAALGVAVDAAGNVYVTANNQVLKLPAK